MSNKLPFKTLSQASEGLYKEKGSKFIGKAYPVASEEDIKAHLSQLRKVFYDASHICYAYILRHPVYSERSNDDGEPSYTAGLPILQQIKQCGLSNVLVVVVRYFGGTKLGTGGLIQAYKAAAEDVLSKASVLTVEPRDHYTISLPYELTGPVMRWIREAQGHITAEQKTAAYEITFHTPVGKLAFLKEKVQALGNKIHLKLHDEMP